MRGGGRGAGERVGIGARDCCLSDSLWFCTK